MFFIVSNDKKQREYATGTAVKIPNFSGISIIYSVSERRLYWENFVGFLHSFVEGTRTADGVRQK